MRKSFTLSLLIGLISIAFSPVKAGVINVAPWGDDVLGDGSPGNPYATIQYALTVAPVNDTVLVGDGYYYGPLIIDKNVSVISQNGPQNCLLDGMYNTSNVIFDTCTATLSGFSVNYASELIRVDGSTVNIENCILDGYGTGNGIIFNSGNGNIHHNIFINLPNTGISFYFGNPSVVNNTFFHTGTAFNINMMANPNVINNIIASNVTGIFLESIYYTGILRFNDIWNNITNISDVLYNIDTSNISANPMFFDTLANNFGLQPGSPCIDAGDPAIYDKDMTRSDIGAISFFTGDNIVFDFYMPSNCSPAYIQFMNNSQVNSQGGSEYYEWEINGTPAFSGFAFDTTLMQGSYYVRLAAFDTSDVLIGEFFRDIYVNNCGGDIVDFYLNYGTNCSPANVGFSNMSYFNSYTGPVSYLWEINGDTFSFSQYPLDTLLYENYYEFKLSAYDTNDILLGVSYKYLDVYFCGGSSIYFYVNQYGYCAGDMVEFINSSSTGGYSGQVFYTWQLNGYVYNGYELPDTNLPGGNYNIILEARDTIGNFLGSYSNNFNVNGSTGIIESSAGLTACPGEMINFWYQGSFWNIRWEMGDGQIYYGDSYIKHTYNAIDTFTIKIFIEDYCGMDTIFRDIIITNTSKPEVFSFTENGNSFCPYDEITFNVEGSYSDVQWTFDDGAVISQPRAIYAFSDTGLHSAIVRVVNICGQIGYDTLFVNIRNDIPVYSGFNWWFEESGSCPLSPVSFSPYGAGNYLWDFGDGVTSTEKNPKHSYVNEGTYEVKLTTFNNCGNSNTSVNYISIYYTNNSFYIDFDIKTYDENYYSSYDTIKICPNEQIKLAPYENSNETYSYYWDFGDGNSSLLKNPVHAYLTAGFKAITLKAKNNCHDTAVAVRYVLVDPTIMPTSKLYNLPGIVCPGEEVYFFDFESDEGKPKFVYNIDFGDGTSKLNITQPEDPKINSLASHVYLGIGTYNYIFTATNLCNNTDTAKRTILVNSDPANVPYYYIHNTTQPHEDEGGKIEDWSINQGGPAHKFVIPVQWPAWVGGMDNTFFVYFWYGEFDPKGDSGEPDGFVSFNSNNIVSGDSVVVFVPVKITEYHSVGLVAGWYCDPAYAGNEPEVMGMPLNGLLQPIKSFPIRNGFSTDLRSYGNIILDPNTQWDGICRSNKPNGEWKSPDGTGKAYYLDLWDYDDGSNEFRLEIGPEIDDPYSSKTYLTSGNYEVNSDTLIFMPFGIGYECEGNGAYLMIYQGDSMILNLIGDSCSVRATALAGRKYYKVNDKSDYYNYQGCPGDSIEFSVVGGETYKWHFGDASAPLTTTNSYVKHAYAGTGIFDAFVVVTNACSRVDTILSPVNIGNQNIPQAYFGMEPWNPEIGDTVYFNYHGYDPSGSLDFTWYFGDATAPAKGPLAKHVYLKGGEFNVRLEVKNGCGVGNQSNYIYIKGENYCDLDARFNANIMTDTVMFQNNSFGNITQLFWDFGDGAFSNEINPVHIYAQPGIYSVCLSIIDSVSNCQDGICLSIQVGTVDCYADFVFSKVDATNTLKLTDKSVGAAFWTWDFGNGNTSTLKDPAHIYTSPGLYRVCLNIANASKTCFAYKCMEIQVGIIDSTECVPEFAYFADSMTVAFNDKSTGNITSWYWKFGDGTSSTKQSVIHNYALSGIYEVCLSVYDSVSNCQKQLCKTIQVGVVNCLSKFTYFIDSTNTATFTDKSIGAVSEWLWDFGDGNMSLKQNPVYTYSKTGMYDVCLTTYDKPTNCLSKSCQRITVGNVQNCFADFAFFIDSMTVRYTDKSLGNVNKRYWDFGNGTFGYSANPVVTYKKPGIKKVCYYVFDTISGCQAQVCKDIEVGTLACNAEFSFYIDPTTKHVDFYNKSNGSINKWLWDFGNGVISFDTNATVTYANYGIYNVCLTVSENVTGGCVSKLCKDVVVKDTISVLCDAKYTYVITQGTRDVTFKDATQTNVTSWFWEFGDGSFSKTPETQHSYVSDGTYEVCLSTYDAITGCFSDVCKNITIQSGADTSEILDANFNYVLSFGSSEVKFVDESTGNPTNWYWTFGDGSYIKGESEIIHNYGKTGDYMVCLYIVDETSGKTDDICKIVPVGESTCTLTSSFSKFIDPDTRTVNFSDKSQGSPAKWFWSFGDGTTSAQQNPEHQYAQAGLYLVSLSIRDAAGLCSDYTADFIQVGSVDCKADFTYTVDADSNKLTLADASKGDVVKYFWSFDDGTFGREANISHKYKEPGMYMVGLTISTSGGACTDYIIEPVQVGTVDCNAEFSAYVDSSTNIAYFSNEVMGNSTLLLWQFGDGAISSLPNPEHKYKAPGYYTVSLNTYDIGTNCMDYTENLILVGSKGIDCEADFYYQVDGKDVDFFDKSIGESLDYFWYFGDGATTSTLPNPSVSYADGGYYLVCLTVNTPGDIQNTRCKYIGVDPAAKDDCLAQFIYTVDSTTRKVTFTDQSLGDPNKWLWKFGDESTSSEQDPSHTYSKNDFYKVRLVSGDSITGCKSRAWELINVGMGTTGIKAGFGYELDNLSLKTGGYPVDFVGVSAGKPARYVWDFGDGDADSSTTSPDHTYTAPGEYTVCLTVEDQVTGESDQTCDVIIIEDTSSVGIEFISPVSIELIEFNSHPNPFSEYTTITYNLPFETKVDLMIYDESGRLIKTLISTSKNAGTHQLIWDAIDVSNGLYYIQLKTGNGYVKTKMVVKR